MKKGKPKQEKPPVYTTGSPNKKGYCWLTGWNFETGWHRNSSPVVPDAKINLR